MMLEGMWGGTALRSAIGYRETQTDGDGRRTVRRSTAVFRREADGLIVWRHLHETPVAA
ncbi:hypothetical protein ACPUER_10565 [Burkholderia sp. DN3021]|uniref:hypothetical protein n=1 Tax=Burkholderia TaxID=32008 RepID=UPI003C7AA099